ncbi:MAG TPA: hypothetical protein VNO14_12730, partial [Blastocatellia bacterium]|nr:hypothetical protein [Blastocatellia bacterium]
MEPSDEGADTGTFFKKYSPRQSSDPSADNKFFRKYGLAQSEDAGHPDEQPEPARLELAANAETRVPDSPSRIARRPFAFTRLRLYSALTVAALLLGVLYT